MKEYLIQGKKLKQQPLTLDQVIGFTDLIESYEVQKENTALSEILRWVVKHKMPEFAKVIFPGQGADEIDWLNVPYEQVDEVVEDFLSLNPRLKKRLSGLLGSSVLKQMIQTT
jgi:hypothetical protein